MSAVLEIRHRWTVFSEPSLSWYGEALRTLQGFLAEWLSLRVPWLMALDELPLNEGSRGTDDVIAPGRGLWESLSPQTQNQSKASVDRRQTLIGIIVLGVTPSLDLNHCLRLQTVVRWRALEEPGAGRMCPTSSAATASQPIFRSEVCFDSEGTRPDLG